LKDVGGDVVVGAVVVAVPGPVDGDGVPGGQGGGDVEVVEVGVAAGRRGAGHEGRAVREELHAAVVLAGPGGRGRGVAGGPGAAVGAGVPGEGGRRLPQRGP